MSRPRALAAVAAAAAFAGFSLLGAGCARWNDLVRHEPQPGPREGDWSEARRAVTRRGQLYDGFEHRATATATYLSPRVRLERAKRLGTWLSWTEPELAKAIAAEKAEADRYEDFVVAFYAADRKTNDLDARETIWRVSLRLDEAELRPTEIVALDADATLVNLFPYVGNFDTVYRIRFPRAPGGPLEGRLAVLEIASALGKMDLDFRSPPAVGAEWPLERLQDR